MTKIKNYFIYGGLIFFSAFLIFQVQLIISRYILPWFGGSSMVWIIASLFFQVMLLLGYLYAHLLTGYFRPWAQVSIYTLVLILALIFLPITPNTVWQPAGGSDPTGQIIIVLLASIGLPFFFFAAASPLFPARVNRADPDLSPYKLYSLSNFGSFLGLFSYPFLVEPLLGVKLQTQVWSFSFGLFVFLAAGLAWWWKKHLVLNQPAVKVRAQKVSLSSPKLVTLFLWLALPAAAAIMLLAVTNKITQDVAVAPFLWVLPLTLYLFSFVVTFQDKEFYNRKFFIPVFVAVTILLALPLYLDPFLPFLPGLVIYLLALFIYCVVCHGELFYLKPEPEQLTLFYLIIALGGVLGGSLVAIIAPLVFAGYFELHLGVILTYLLMMISLLLNRQWLPFNLKPISAWSITIAIFFGVSIFLAADIGQTISKPVFISRNFYGVLRVSASRLDQPQKAGHFLYNGGIIHGFEYQSPDQLCLPTTYYGQTSGVGLTLRSLPGRPGRLVGLVGLGTGTLAAYARPSDHFRFYEINPAVQTVAEKYFNYLSKCAQGQVDVILGDARLSLEEEASNQFDILVLDAFSSDAIPVHLLTQEAFANYWRVLRPDGVFAVHVSNQYVDLEPVVFRLADYFGLTAVLISNIAAPDKMVYNSDWVIVTKNSDFLNLAAIKNSVSDQPVSFSQTSLWTDDYTNLFGAIRWY